VLHGKGAPLEREPHRVAPYQRCATRQQTIDMLAQGVVLALIPLVTRHRLSRSLVVVVQRQNQTQRCRISSASSSSPESGRFTWPTTSSQANRRWERGKMQWPAKYSGAETHTLTSSWVSCPSAPRWLNSMSNNTRESAVAPGSAA